MKKIAIDEMFTRITDYWQPRVVAQMNGQDVRLVKCMGSFPWHIHEDADEMFLVWKGRFKIEFRDKLLELEPGEIAVVPRGTEHRTLADEEAEILIFEPSEVVNTGNLPANDFTADRVHLE